MQNYNQAGVSLEAAFLFLRGRGKVVYISPSSDPTLALLLMGYTEYDDDDELHYPLAVILFGVSLTPNFYSKRPTPTFTRLLKNTTIMILYFHKRFLYHIRLGLETVQPGD
ncbi:hypothetical protein Hanom_Chr12g01145811 [Helianthus anomalus]